MKKIEVVAGVILKDHKILSTQRGYGEFKGDWEFPGGKIEPYENHAQALMRELKEELAVKVQVKDFLTTVDYDYDSFHLTMHCYFCSLCQGSELKLLEHLSARWLSLAELDEVNWLEADLPVVRLLKKRLGNS